MTVSILTITGGVLLLLAMLNLMQHVWTDAPVVDVSPKATPVILIFALGSLGFAAVYGGMFWLAILNFAFCFFNMGHII